MSKRLDENLGSVGYDGLIVANEPVADVFTVTIRKEATAAATYKRGTVMALSASGTAADVTALAYRTGHFARNKLIVKDSYTLKATDEEELRKAGILLSDAIEY